MHVTASVASHDVHCSQVLRKPVGSSLGTSFPPRKVFSAVLCSSWNVKIPSSSAKTAATVASTLISLAAATLAVAFSTSWSLLAFYKESGLSLLELEWSLQCGCSRFWTWNLSNPAALQGEQVLSGSFVAPLLFFTVLLFRELVTSDLFGESDM